MTDKILVIMTVFNENLLYITDSINSMLLQTYKNFDLVIVIDNPSIDKECISYIKQLESNDIRVKVVENEVNIGLALSLNKAVKSVSILDYAYIARMDADDISDKKRLESQVVYMKRNDNIDLLGSSAFIINENGILINEMNMCENVSLNYGSNSIHPSWLMKTEVFIRNNGYRNFSSAQDYDFLCRAALNGFEIANVNEKVIYYRLHRGSIGAVKRLNQRRFKYFIAKNYRKKTLLKVKPPVLMPNLMSRAFNFVEKVKLKNKAFGRCLSFFSYYHLVNYYYEVMKFFGGRRESK